MVRLNNDSQNLALPLTTNATSRVASRQAQNTQRGTAAEARSRVSSAKYSTQVTEDTQNMRANELGGGAAAQGSSAPSSAARGELEEVISDNLELAKSMKKFYEAKIESVSSQGNTSSDYARAMMENYRQELSLYQSATDFWSIERKTSYQYAEEDIPKANQLYDQITALQSTYDQTGTSIFQIADKTLELYTLKQGENPFGENSSVNPAGEQANHLLRLSAAKGRNADSQNQVDKWLAYDGDDQEKATAALASAKNQAGFTKTSIDIWENRLNFWNDLSEQTHFIEDKERLDKIEVLSTRMTELEGILEQWLSKTDDIDNARNKASDTLGLIGDLEVEIRKLFI